MGKLIVFWSPLHGQTKATASMAAVAMAMSNITEESVVMFHTQTGFADLEGMFDRRRDSEQRDKIYEGCGLNALLLDFKRTALTSDMIHDASLPTAIENLSFLPGIETNGAKMGKDQTEILYSMAVRDIPKAYDWTFVDLSSGIGSPLSHKIIESADVLVVTFSQNVALWDRCFEDYADFIEDDKVFYLIGGHKQESSYCVKNFRRIKHVDKARSGVVPSSIGYMDAISHGTVDTFFLMNEKAGKGEENEIFMNECKECAAKIRDLAYGKSKRKGEE